VDCKARSDEFSEVWAGLYNNARVICPLCGTRRARRGCPALGKQICAICCGTKRLIEIQCPSDCTWLASAREHPPAVAVRQQQRDLGLVMQSMRDFTSRQSQLFLLVTTFLVRYEAPELQRPTDDDVAEAMNALASTFETSSRGVIYEHRPASLAASHLMNALKPVLAEAGQGGGTAFERDSVVILRRIAEAVPGVRADEPGNPRALLDLLGRVIRATGNEERPPEAAPQDAPRLIVP
jgi:hypothetical protein